MRTYQSACHAITDSARAVVIPCGDDFVNELAAFRDAAERFGIAAKEAGLYDLTDVAGLLEDLVSVVAREAGMLTCAAQAVAEAASNAERQKGHLVERLLQHNPLRFVPEPSFIE